MAHTLLATSQKQTEDGQFVHNFVNLIPLTSDGQYLVVGTKHIWRIWTNKIQWLSWLFFVNKDPTRKGRKAASGK